MRYGARKEGPFPVFRKETVSRGRFTHLQRDGPRRGSGGKRKAPWSPSQRRNLLRYGARKEGPFPAFHLKFVSCGRFRPPAGGRGTFPHGKVPKGCRGRPKGACLMAAPGPPVAKLQCTASLAGARPAGFTSVPGRAAVAFGAVDPSPGGWAPVYPWSRGKVPLRQRYLVAIRIPAGTGCRGYRGKFAISPPARRSHAS